MDITTTRHNYFSTHVLAEREATIYKARIALADVDFDTFVGIGMSGATAATLLGYALNKNVFLLRKESEESHDYRKDYGVMGEKWVFIDDFIQSGNTRRVVMERMEALENDEVFGLPDRLRGTTQYVGDYLYCESQFYPGGYPAAYMW